MIQGLRELVHQALLFATRLSEMLVAMSASEIQVILLVLLVSGLALTWGLTFSMSRAIRLLNETPHFDFARSEGAKEATIRRFAQWQLVLVVWLGSIIAGYYTVAFAKEMTILLLGAYTLLVTYLTQLNWMLILKIRRIYNTAASRLRECEKQQDGVEQ